ncbi:MAG: RraA family protein [Propionibacteriales bacterium]|nr:RraA family protein [Propionibacteriales bacterium]
MEDATEREEIRDRFLLVDTANVADVLDDLGLPDQGLSPEFQAASGTRLAGWVYTIAGQMMAYAGSGDTRKMEACNGIGPHEVSVWSGDGEGVCYFGELIALGMAQRGSTGALVDGGVRDTRALRDHEFPVFARYRSSVQSIGRWRVTAWQVAVAVAGATSRRVIVYPGDFVVADEDGAIVVPHDRVAEVLDRSEAMTRSEVSVREALRAGMSLSDALDQFGHV